MGISYSNQVAIILWDQVFLNLTAKKYINI